MREFFEHITKVGDRWDLIAHQYYNDATMIRPILLANPEITGRTDQPTPLVLQSGQTIRVPVLPEEQVAQNQLPPWKRV